MKLIDINPHIRFAEQITYIAKNIHVYVKDCRLFYISDGKGIIYINYNQLNLNKNTLFYCCGGSDYSIEADNPIKLYSLNFDLSQNKSHLTSTFTLENFNKTKKQTPIDKCHIEDSHFLNSFLLFENALIFRNAFSEITEEFSSQQIYYREKCSSILKKLLIELHRTDIKQSVISHDTLQKITEYINLNFKKEIKNNELANIAGYHEYYLNRLFLKHMGMSMHKYILNLRINEGKRLLLNSDIPVSVISSQIGFHSHTHFATYFKKETTMTPLEFRNNFKNNI